MLSAHKSILSAEVFVRYRTVGLRRQRVAARLHRPGAAPLCSGLLSGEELAAQPGKSVKRPVCLLGLRNVAL